MAEYLDQVKINIPNRLGLNYINGTLNVFFLLNAHSVPIVMTNPDDAFALEQGAALVS